MKRHAFGIPQSRGVFCYGDEENTCIYAVHLTTANQSETREACFDSVA